MNRHRGLAIALALLFGAAEVRADHLSGWQAIGEGAYAAARAAWLDDAHAGDIDLQFNIGLLHESGLLGEVDHEAAVRWYRAAAARGLPAAQDRLAGLAMRGAGMEADAAFAVDLLTKAAEAGYAPAQNNLAVAHELGLHLPQDADLAALWYRRAAARGLPEAQYALGRLLMAGGHGSGRRDFGGRDFGGGAPGGRGFGGRDFGGGAPGGRDTEQALAWYRAAADAGLAEAENNLALMYERGEGVPKDLATAVSWYRRAADKGLAVAQNNLGIMLQYGRGVAVDPVAAAMRYRAAAMGGDPFGQINLANACANGLGVAQDFAEAYAWILLARISDDAEARATAAEYGRRLSPRLTADTHREAIARAQALRDAVADEALRRSGERLWPMAVEDMGSPAAAAQRLLKVLGYLSGPVDGIAGPATLASARSFQRDRGLEADGRIGDDLVAALAEVAARRAPRGVAPDNTSGG
ncbi:MAG: SEL1-like repeat protein [Rhodospirillales bacterium]|nr:SEL1-like repeat protein [Rhodospirillales bacterium]